MADFAAVRDGLKFQLETIDGLRAHDTVPASLQPPAAVVGGVERAELIAFGGKRAWTVPIRLYVSKASDRTAQDRLDAYLASTGAASVIAALEGDVTLGGAADTLLGINIRIYGVFEVAGIQYLGAELEVVVVA